MVKNPPENQVGRPPGEENNHSLQYSCLGTPMDRGTWWATFHWVTRVRHHLVSKPPHLGDLQCCGLPPRPPIYSNYGTSQVVLVVKNSLTNAGNIRDAGLIPGLGRSPGGGHGNALQYSCLENPMDRGAWWAIVHGVVKSQTQLKWLSWLAIQHLYSLVL